MPRQCPLIIALDCGGERAAAIIDATHDLVDCYKIGPQLLLAFSGGGWWLTAMLALSHHRQIFLDLKLADTRDTARAVVERCAEIGVEYLSVMPRPGVYDWPRPARPKLLAVLALSDRIGAQPKYVPLRDQAGHCDYDGVIHPAGFASVARKEFPDLIVACPGVRMPGESADNHVAPGTPGMTIADGADFVIIGRPIVQSADPRRAVQAVLDDIARKASQPGTRPL